MSRFDLQGIGMTSQRTRNRLADRLRAGGIADERVLAAIARVPRHIFVDEALAHRAYEDDALPIGHSQTISQPFVVATMTEAILAHRPQHTGAAHQSAALAGHRRQAPNGWIQESGDLGRVLEIGTGSGYQTAVLAMVAQRVYTIERIGALLDRARQRFQALSLRNVYAKHGDGALGWPQAAPFDAVVVTAGADRVPPALTQQLAHGASLVMPVGDADAQQLRVVERSSGIWRQRSLSRVRFVPLRPGIEP